MAQQLETTTVCDLCLAGSPSREQAAETYRFSLNSSRPIELDLCDVHARRLVVPLDIAASQYGRKVSQATLPRKRRKLAHANGRTV